MDGDGETASLFISETVFARWFRINRAMRRACKQDKIIFRDVLFLCRFSLEEQVSNNCQSARCPHGNQFVPAVMIPAVHTGLKRDLFYFV